MNRLLTIFSITLLITCFILEVFAAETQQDKLNKKLLDASLQGDINSVRGLLKMGADVNTVGIFYSRPLHLASSSNRDLPELVALLIKEGAKLNPQNSAGQTPLHLAVDYGRTDSIKILLDSGADPFLKDKEGKTAKDYTLKNGYKTIFSLISKAEQGNPQKSASEPVEIRKKMKRASISRLYTNSINMKFVYIKPGVFMMGSPPSDPQKQKNEAQHQVTITKGFYIQTTEVTQGQWKRVMGIKAPIFKNKGDNFPVVKVSWYDSQNFIKKLNELEKTDKYRLPTEAQWEYACRARTKTPFPWNDSKDQLCYYANVADKTANKKMFGNKVHQCKDGYVYAAPVGSFKANGFGLYDMIGNVWEWCQDRYSTYSVGSVIDPKGPSTGTLRVMRGGGWDGKYIQNRSAYRGKGLPGRFGRGLGFRVVLMEFDG